MPRLLPLLFLLLTSTLHAQSQQDKHYSVGYRMGLFTKFSYAGYLMKSWEGELLLGNQSTVAEGFNPWSFSVDPKDSEIVKRLEAALGHFVILKYEQDLMVISRNTGYKIVDVLPVNNQASPSACISTSHPRGTYSEGTRMGRLVKVSYRGLSYKSWEVVMQVGPSGGQFFEMSVIGDEAMAQCLIDYMATGRKALITYNQSAIFNPTESSSSYQILRAEPIKSGFAE